MPKANRAVSVGAVLVAMAIIFIVGFGLYLSAILNAPAPNKVNISIGTRNIPPSTSSTTQATSSTESFVSSPCATTFQNGLNPPFNTKISIMQNSSIQVCVNYYYFNSTGTETINFTSGRQILQISGMSVNGPPPIASNFTVSSSASLVTFGGADNQSEGTDIVYTITPRQGINGTYGFNFGWLYPSMQACTIDFLLVIGNGLPNYGQNAGCTAPMGNSSPSNSQIAYGFLFAEIVGVSNGTIT